jgi:hypothetical protein
MATWDGNDYLRTSTGIVPTSVTPASRSRSPILSA